MKLRKKTTGNLNEIAINPAVKSKPQTQGTAHISMLIPPRTIIISVFDLSFSCMCDYIEAFPDPSPSLFCQRAPPGLFWPQSIRNTNLCVVPKPPDISECSHLAWPEHCCGVDLLVLGGDKGQRQVNVFQGTCRNRSSRWVLPPSEKSTWLP